jgi:hypothetical protein
MINIDAFVKSPYAALRFITRHCNVPVNTSHSSLLAHKGRLYVCKGQLRRNSGMDRQRGLDDNSVTQIDSAFCLE